MGTLDELQFDPALETMNLQVKDTFHGRARASTENLQNKTRTRYAEIDL